MGQSNNTVIIVIVVVGVVLLAALVGGALFLGSARVMHGGGVQDSDFGYTVAPGAVTVMEDGSRRATLHVQVLDGWSLNRLRLRDAELRSGTRSQELSLASSLPSFPVTQGFDLVYALPAAAVAEAGAAPVRLRVGVASEASSGVLGMTRANGDRTLLFLVRDDRLVDSRESVTPKPGRDAEVSPDD